MATEAELTRIVRGLNAVRTNAQAAAFADRAQGDGRKAVALTKHIVTQPVQSAVRAVQLAMQQVDRWDDEVRGAPEAPVGRTWQSLRQAVIKVYVDIAGLEATAEATGVGAAIAGAVKDVLGDSATWWEKYGDELAAEPNLLKRAGMVVGDAGQAVTETAGAIAQPVLSGASSLLWQTLVSALPILILAGVIVAGVAAAQQLGRRIA